MIECPNPNCKYSNSLIEINCVVCNTFLGYPNVNDAQREEQLVAFNKRYDETLLKITDDSHRKKIKDFENAIETEARAVVNIDLDYLEHFIINKNILYSSYGLSTAGETREYAKSQFDKERRGVEGFIFGSNAHHIRYAALSLNKSGLKSYGDYTLSLKNIAIADRGTVFEENSYIVFQKYFNQNDFTFENGHVACWGNKHLLAVVKCSEEIIKKNKTTFADILLKSTGDRKTDNFMEVHIFGTFKKESIESVKGSSKLYEPLDKLKSEKIKDYLTSLGIDWIEE
jgi:hypothetical protein